MDYYSFSPLFFVLRIIEVFSQFMLVLVISNTEFNVKRFLSASLILATLFELSKIIIPQYLTAVVSVILATLVIVYILKINFKKAIISYAITIVTMAIIDCIVSMILIKFYNLPTFEDLTQSDSLAFLGKASITTIMFLITIIIKAINLKNKKEKIENINNSTSLINIIVTFFLLIPNLVMIVYYHDNKTLPLAIILTNMISIIAMFFISLFNTQRSIKLVQAEEELITEKTYNSTLQHLVDSLRTFKHDYNNTLNTINGYIFVKDWDGLKNFVSEVIKETNTITSLDRLNPELFRNPSLFGLVTAKFEYARKSDVTMNFEIYADLDDINIKTYDFTRILGIFLDNAIEAAAGSEKKVVNFYVVEKNGKVTIEISNSFSDTGLDINSINKKGVSSKGTGRGLGLYKVKDILTKYPKIKHDTTSSNGMFLQKLVIDKVKVSI